MTRKIVDIIGIALIALGILATLGVLFVAAARQPGMPSLKFHGIAAHKVAGDV